MSLMPSRKNSRSKVIGTKIGANKFVTRDTLTPSRSSSSSRHKLVSNRGSFHDYQRGMLILGDSMVRHFDTAATSEESVVQIGRTLMEHIDIICSLDFTLQIIYICSIKNSSYFRVI